MQGAEEYKIIFSWISLNIHRIYSKWVFFIYIFLCHCCWYKKTVIWKIISFDFEFAYSTTKRKHDSAESFPNRFQNHI
jgi:hypothetical protein